MQNKTYQCNEVIFEQGAYASSMYEVSSGSVGVFANYGTNDERKLAMFGPSSFFGEMGLVECYPRSATAVALDDDTTVIEIGPDDFSSFYQDQPEKVLSVMRQLSARLRETDKRYQEACQAVYDAIEAEKAGQRRSHSIRSKLSGMLKSFRKSGSNA